MPAHNHARYKTLGQEIIDQIQRRQLKEGEKLPSLRRLCEQHKISMTTAIHCFEYVEALGFIIALPKKGFFVTLPLNQQAPEKFPQFIGKSKKNPLKQNTVTRLIQHRAASTNNEKVHPLSSGQLGPSLTDNKNINLCLNRTLRHCQFEHFTYGDPGGDKTLRQTLSRHFFQQGLPLDSDALMISNGCIDAITLTLETITQHGDTIAVNSPCYNGLLQIISLMGRYVLEIPSTPEGLDLEQLQHLAKGKKIHACLLTANHQNPTGHKLPNKQKKALAELAQQYCLPIIEDDVYCELTHNGAMPLPIKYWDKGDWVIWCGSVSKSLSPGLRIGWLYSARFYDNLLKQRFIRTLGINQPIQLGLAEYINTGLYSKHLIKVNFHLKNHVIEYRKKLNSILPKGSYISNPTGGMVLWVKVPKLNSQNLMNCCEQDDIYIRSGELFSSRKLYCQYFRINIGWELSPNIEQQLQHIGQHIADLI